MSLKSTSSRSKTVGEIFKVLGGGTPKTSNPDFWNGDIPWVTSADLDEDFGATPRKRISKEAINSSATHLVPAGSIIVATRVGLGKLAIAPTDICFSQDCQGLIVDSKICCSKFAAHQLKLRVQNFQHISRGTTISGVTKKQLLEVPFDLPPLDEQRRIVAEIEKQFTRLGAGVAALQRVQAKLKRYRASVLKSACEGRLVPTEFELARAEGRDYESAKVLLQRILTERREKWNGRGKYKEPAAPDIANLPELPKDWVWASVTQISSEIVDCPHSTAKFVAEGFPCVDTTCIRPGKIICEKLRYVSAGTYDSRIQRLRPMADDIIFAREGTVGTAVTIPENLSPCLGQRVMLMRSDACVVPTYFQHCLNSVVIRSQYLPKIVGSTAPHLNVAEVKLLAIPLPPLIEQRRIVIEIERRLSIIDDIELTITKNLQRAMQLRQSILQQFFSGESV